MIFSLQILDMRDSMVFYNGFLDALDVLDEKDRLSGYEYIWKYGLRGVEPDEDGSGPALALFKIAKPLIDKNNKRYENAVKGGKATKAQKLKNRDKTSKTSVRSDHININKRTKSNTSCDRRRNIMLFYEESFQQRGSFPIQKGQSVGSIKKIV